MNSEENTPPSVEAVSSGQLPVAGHESLKTRAMSELKAFFYITMYFWVLFLTFGLYKAAILQEHNISVEGQSFAIVNALVLAKVTLIVETFYTSRRLQNVPLVYAVLSHALLLSLILVAFHGIEEVLKAMIHGKSLAASIAGIGDGQLSNPFSMGAIFFVMLIPFCAFRELARLFGSEPFSRVFLGSRSGLTFKLVTDINPGPAVQTNDFNPLK